jgi:hypothetical protein
MEAHMSNRSFVGFVLLPLAAVMFWTTTMRGGEPKSNRKFELQSQYLEKGMDPLEPGGAKIRTIFLLVELDDKGGGKATLLLDRNTRGGGALIDMIQKSVTLKLVKDEDAVLKGRQLYELSGYKSRQLLLAVPTANRPCWLVIAGKQGVEDMIELYRQKETPKK